MVDCDEFEQRDFEKIHIYIRKTLDPKNKRMVIRTRLITDEQHEKIKRMTGIHG